MWDLDYKESWALNWCFWTVVLEKTLGSPLDCKGIKLVNSEGNQSWIFIRGTYAEAEALILWPPDLSHWKSPWCWERLKAGGEGNDRGWDVWMASLTQSTGVWAISWRWGCTGKSVMLQSMELQRVGHDWMTLQQEQYFSTSSFSVCLYLKIWSDSLIGSIGSCFLFIVTLCLNWNILLI